MKTTAFYNTVLINYSTSNSVKAGKFYTTLQQGEHRFLFDENGKRIIIQEPEFKWKDIDKVVMIAKIKTSLLDSVLQEKVYRVFNDEKNDERYIINENGEKVLFDKMMFNYELI